MLPVRASPPRPQNPNLYLNPSPPHLENSKIYSKIYILFQISTDLKRKIEFGLDFRFPFIVGFYN
jgi:CMP-N-acetylneuraminic acid synthetase